MSGSAGSWTRMAWQNAAHGQSDAVSWILIRCTGAWMAKFPIRPNSTLISQQSGQHAITLSARCEFGRRVTQPCTWKWPRARLWARKQNKRAASLRMRLTRLDFEIEIDYFLLRWCAWWCIQTEALGLPSERERESIRELALWAHASY